MVQVNVHEAKTHFSRLLEQVEQGEEVLIARRGKVIARLVREKPKPKVDRMALFGALAGQIRMSDDFDDPLPPEIQRYFDGEDDQGDLESAH
jgi:prevent-host-death family protein